MNKNKTREITRQSLTFNNIPPVQIYFSLLYLFEIEDDYIFSDRWEALLYIYVGNNNNLYFLA